MESYELVPLKDNTIPSKINRLTKDLTNYIIVKDGHIVKRALSTVFESIFVDSYSEALPDKLTVFLDTEYVNNVEDEAYKYNVENVNSGLLIHVPRNINITDTLHVFYIQENIDLVNNTRIVLENNSALTYFEYLYNESDSSINFVSNVVVKENAHLTYSGISNFNILSVVSVVRNAFVKRYGNAKYNIAEINDGTLESRTNIYLEEQYASATTKTVAITNKEQDANIRQLVEHNAPDTEGFIENYGVSNNNSTLIFEGIGKINKNMKRSVARQSNKGIVLGRKSRLDANPLLLIDEYDVVASHGAAIGKIDDEQLYYLMSRGLTLKVAERLIISGFLSPILQVLSTDALKEEFLNIVENKTT